MDLQSGRCRKDAHSAIFEKLCPCPERTRPRPWPYLRSIFLIKYASTRLLSYLHSLLTSPSDPKWKYSQTTTKSASSLRRPLPPSPQILRSISTLLPRRHCQARWPSTMRSLPRRRIVRKFTLTKMTTSMLAAQGDHSFQPKSVPSVEHS